MIGRAFGFSVSRIRTGADLASLPDRLLSPEPEFIVVDTSFAAVLPAPMPT